MADGMDFRELQYRFTAHIRDPASRPAPDGIEERRLQVYRELLFNNTRGFLDNGFPVLRAIYGAIAEERGTDDAWERLTRDFFARHRSKTPYFLEIGGEFLNYLEHEHRSQPGDPPFLQELAHYEWVEVALSVADVEPDLATVDAGGDLLAARPVLSPLAWPLSYAWPVHRIGPAFIPQTPPPAATHLLVYRDPSDAVHFVELNPVSARLLALQGNADGRCGRELLTQIAAELAHPLPDAVIQGGLALLEDLHRRGAVLGTRRD